MERVGRLRAFGDPIFHAVGVDDFLVVLEIIGAEDLVEASAFRGILESVKTTRNVRMFFLPTLWRRILSMADMLTESGQRVKMDYRGCRDTRGYREGVRHIGDERDIRYHKVEIRA